MDNPHAISYEQRALDTLKELGIPYSFVESGLNILHPECHDLISIGPDMFNRDQRLERHTAAQWHAMVATAATDGVTLLSVSGFRSFDYQKGIIQRKLAKGLSIEEIVSASALPGYSEHHTGKAIDIGAPGSPPLEEEFEKTEAFQWLNRRAVEFGFYLSYPRDNPYRIIYEPWHWFRR